MLRPRVNIHMPWKLVVGNHCWIGEGCEFLNLETITLEDHVAVAHRVYFAAGSHDYTDHTMPYKNAPITVETGTWVASNAFIGPGTVIGQHSVVEPAASSCDRFPWASCAATPQKLSNNEF